MKKHWSLIWRIAITDFKLRYHGSFLGFFWTLLKPLSFFLVLNFVFGSFFGREEHYALKLLLGILLWSFFSESTSMLIRTLVYKSNLITKTYVPRFIFILSGIISSSIGFFLTLIVLAGFFFYYGVIPSVIGVLQFFIILLCLIGLCMSIGFLSAPFFPRFRDLHQIWDVLLKVGFYATPIIYPLTALSPEVQRWLWYNPMTIIIEFSRSTLFEDAITWSTLSLMILVVVLALGFSIIWFQKFQHQAIEHL